jgi:hypothetical protein
MCNGNFEAKILRTSQENLPELKYMTELPRNMSMPVDNSVKSTKNSLPEVIGRVRQQFTANETLREVYEKNDSIYVNSKNLLHWNLEIFLSANCVDVKN